MIIRQWIWQYYTNDFYYIQVVAFLAPSITPWVLDAPVWLAIVSAIASDENTVVQTRGWAEERIGNTSHVELHPFCVDADAERAMLHKERCDLVLILADCSPVADFCNELALVNLARAIHCSVWVWGFRFNTTCLHDVFVCIGWETTVAARIDLVTINQLLFRQASQWVSCQEVCTFNVTSGLYQK